MRVVLILMAILQFCCGTVESTVNYESSIDRDARLLPIVNEYLDYSNSLGIPTPNYDLVTQIKFGQLDDDVLGLCELFWGNRKITIREGLDPMILRVVVYHELGHCVHDMEHFNTSVDIMNAGIIMNSAIWRQKWDEMRKQMFGRLNPKGYAN